MTDSVERERFNAELHGEWLTQHEFADWTNWLTDRLFRQWQASVASQGAAQDSLTKWVTKVVDAIAELRDTIPATAARDNAINKLDALRQHAPAAPKRPTEGSNETDKTTSPQTSPPNGKTHREVHPLESLAGQYRDGHNIDKWSDCTVASFLGNYLSASVAPERRTEESPEVEKEQRSLAGSDLRDLQGSCRRGPWLREHDGAAPECPIAPDGSQLVEMLLQMPVGSKQLLERGTEKVWKLTPVAAPERPVGPIGNSPLGTCDTTDWPHLASDGTGKKPEGQ